MAARDSERAEEWLRALGNRFRELRKSAGLSQEQLAFKSGLDRTYISGIERGRRNFSVLNAFVIAEALGVEIGDFFTDI